MHKEFHQLAPILALQRMPDKFRAFFIADGFTEDDLKRIADLPDLVDLDNIEQDPFCRHAHSYKMELSDGQLKWMDGEALDRVKNLAEDARDYYREKNFAMVRYSLAKATHYSIDAKTFPHLSPGKPWSDYHAKFEDHMASFITKHQNEIGSLEFIAYKDVVEDSGKITRELWYAGQEVVKVYLDGGKVSDELAMDVCSKCIKGVGDLWVTVARELKII